MQVSIGLGELMRFMDERPSSFSDELRSRIIRAAQERQDQGLRINDVFIVSHFGVKAAASFFDEFGS